MDPLQFKVFSRGKIPFVIVFVAISMYSNWNIYIWDTYTVFALCCHFPSANSFYHRWYNKTIALAELNFIGSDSLQQFLHLILIIYCISCKLAGILAVLCSIRNTKKKNTTTCGTVQMRARDAIEQSITFQIPQTNG